MFEMAIDGEANTLKEKTVENGNYTVRGGALLLANPSKNAAPMLRTTFTTAPQKHQIVTARGIYEMYLNGQRVSNEMNISSGEYRFEIK